jgi:hypothetical protein
VRHRCVVDQTCRDQPSHRARGKSRTYAGSASDLCHSWEAERADQCRTVGRHGDRAPGGCPSLTLIRSGEGLNWARHGVLCCWEVLELPRLGGHGLSLRGPLWSSGSVSPRAGRSSVPSWLDQPWLRRHFRLSGPRPTSSSTGGSGPQPPLCASPVGPRSAVGGDTSARMLGLTLG